MASIIAREHHFESWEQFAAFTDAMKDARSPVAPLPTSPTAYRKRFTTLPDSDA